jgi:hypothetical protein
MRFDPGKAVWFPLGNSVGALVRVTLGVIERNTSTGAA